jgi:Ca2+-binding EF-hand superfamily protein
MLNTEDQELQHGTKFKQLPAQEIERIRDAFQLIDQDNNGSISSKDLKTTFQSISQEKSDKDIEAMLKSNDLGFPAFLSLISNELNQLPDRSEILRALQVFSQDTLVDSNDLRNALIDAGMDRNEVNPVLEAFETERMNGDKIFQGQVFLDYVSN